MKRLNLFTNGIRRTMLVHDYEAKLPQRGPMFIKLLSEHQSNALLNDKKVFPGTFAMNEGLEKLPVNFSADEIRQMIKEVVG